MTRVELREAREGGVRTTTGLIGGGGCVGSVVCGVVAERDANGLEVLTTADDGRCS
jgi:hypothetical protein